MVLKDVLLQFITRKELTIRISNNQIKINNKTVKDIFLEVGFDGEWYWEFDEWVCINLSLCQKAFIFTENIKDLFEEGDTNVEAFEFFSSFTLLSISKKEEYVFLNH